MLVCVNTRNQDKYIVPRNMDIVIDYQLLKEEQLIKQRTRTANVLDHLHRFNLEKCLPTCVIRLVHKRQYDCM